MKIEERIQDIVKKRTESDEFSGVIFIRRDGKELFYKALGYASKGWKIKNSKETGFRIASISKMFTAAAILQLIEKGLLKFETSVVDYLNLQSTKISTEVTIENLLTHTSGIADYFDESLGADEWEKLWCTIPIYNIRKLEDYLPFFIDKEHISKTGERYHYNGAGYILLGLCIEKASGLSYFEYVKKNVFEKANMENTNFIALDEISENVAEGYEPIRNSSNRIVSWKKNIYLATPEAASDGGATSTVDDLIRFLDALKTGKLFGEEMRVKMFEPKVLVSEVPLYNSKMMYGYGNIFLIDNENETLIRFGHTGEEYGVSCRLFSYPRLNIDVAILGNQGMCAGPLAMDIQSLLMDDSNF